MHVLTLESIKIKHEMNLSFSCEVLAQDIGHTPSQQNRILYGSLRNPGNPYTLLQHAIQVSSTSLSVLSKWVVLLQRNHVNRPLNLLSGWGDWCLLQYRWHFECFGDCPWLCQFISGGGIIMFWQDAVMYFIG